MTREEKPNETPRKEKMQEALAHYDEIATKACWHRSDIPEAIRAYYASPSSATAEEILQKYMDMSMIICPLHVVPRTVALDAMHEFATLHAQKIADKMVSERLRETTERCKKLEFMIDKGLGWKDMENDITMPHEL